MASDLEYMQLATRVYQTRLPANRTVNVEWQKVDEVSDLESGGFSAGIYTKGSEAVIAFTGTNDWKDVFAYSTALGIVSTQIFSAIKYYLDFKAAHPQYTISFTGHSLGGGIASLLGVLFNKKSVVFDQMPSEWAARSDTFLAAVAIGFGSYNDPDLAAYLISRDLSARESNVAGYYVDGEFLSYLRLAPTSTLMGTGKDHCFGLGGSNAGMFERHTMALMTAIKVSGSFWTAVSSLPCLTTEMLNENLFAADPKNDGRKDILRRLLNNQLGSEGISTNNMLNRFACDALKIAQKGGLTVNANVAKGLASFAMQAYRDKDEFTSNGKFLFTNVNGGINFNRGDIADTLGDVKGYTKYFKKYLDTSLSKDEQKVVSEKLPDVVDWYVQAGSGGMSATAGDDSDFMLGGDREDHLTGGDGDDVLVGGQGEDHINGGAGDDVICGGWAADILQGGPGDDLYVGQRFPDASGASGQLDWFIIKSGEGNDTIDDDDGNIRFAGRCLNNVQATKKEGESAYKESEGNPYSYSWNGDGTDLVITKEGEDATVTIKKFINGTFGIYLDKEKEEEPLPIDPETPNLSKYPVWKDPLILDLDHDNIETTPLDDGVFFDHDANGFTEKTAWISSDDGLLVLDRNGDGVITSGKELFGDQTVLVSGRKASNGFEALAELDSNGDGVIDGNDPAYAQLRVWQDVNQDGLSSPDELLSLSSLGITSISTTSTAASSVDDQGNRQTHTGGFTLTDGTAGQIASFILQRDPKYRIQMEKLPVPDDIASLPDLQGYGTVYDLHQAMVRDATGQLKSLVEQFASATDPTTRKSLMNQILFAWTGTGDINPTGRGENIDARQVAVLEKMFSQSFGGSYIDSNSARALKESFEGLAQSYYACLMAGTHFKQFFESITYTWDETNQSIHADLTTIIANIRSQLTSDPEAGKLTLSEFSRTLKILAPNLMVDYLSFREAFIQQDPELGWVIDSAGLSVILPSGTPTYYRHFMGTDDSEAMRASPTWGDGCINGGAGNDVIYGTDRNENFFKSLGSVLVVAGGGNDYVSASSSADIIDGGPGDDHLIGEEGNDTYIFRRGSGQDTITDTDPTPENSDTLWLGPGIATTDVTVRRMVNDLRLSINGTNDQITVENHFKNDSPISRIERIQFQDGTVWSDSDVSERIMVATEGDDTIYGHFESDDEIQGLGGNDSLYGQGGNDRLYGNAGNDRLYGGDGDDLLDGGAGNDVLIGGTGEYSYTWYASWSWRWQWNAPDTPNGNDTYVFGRGYGQDVVMDHDSSADNFDKILLNADVSPTDVVLRRDEDNLVLSLAGTEDKLTVNNWFLDESAEWRVEAIQFSNADGTAWDVDTIKQLVIQGTPGEDVLIGYSTADSISGMDGDDRIYGLAGDDTLSGGAGGDMLLGGAGDDTLDAGAGNDTLFGGTADASLALLYNSAIPNSSNGNDTYVFGRGYGQDTVIDRDVTPGNIDTILFNAGIAPSDIKAARNGENLVLSIIGGNDMLTVKNWFLDDSSDSPGEWEVERIQFADGTNWDVDAVRQFVLDGTPQDDTIISYSTDDTMLGREGNDFMFGHAGDDTIDGGPGDDYLSGDSGNDFLRGGEGNDAVYGEEGDDTLFGESGRDKLYGGDGDDTIDGGTDGDQLFGEAGNDTLRGNSGNDAVIAGEGNDVLDGGAGNDILVGGEATYVYNYWKQGYYLGDTPDKPNGNDTYLFGRGSGQDTVLDHDSTSGNLDTILLASDVGSTDVSLRRSNNDLVLSINDTADTMTVNNWFLNESAEWRVERIQFADGATWGVDAIKQLVLQGTPGNDELTGYSSADTLNGLAGDDILNGGLSNDTYLFGRGYGKDTIKDVDGTPGNVDTVIMAADLAPTDVTVKVGGKDVFVTINGTEDTLKLSDWLASDASKVERIQFADGTVWNSAYITSVLTTPTDTNDYLVGTPDADVIDGGGGDDVMYGLEGDDVLYGGEGSDGLFGDWGNDTLYGGPGNDQLYGDEGDDTFDGGSGDDYINSGPGENTFLFNPGSGFDTIEVSVSTSPEQNDAVVFGQGIAPENLRVQGTTRVVASQTELDLAIGIDDDEGVLLKTSYLNDGGGYGGGSGYGGDLSLSDLSVKRFIFADGQELTLAQVLARADDGVIGIQQGTNEDDFLKGSVADDTIYGKGGSDRIDARDNKDIVNGGEGDDIISAGSGQDVVYGGDGSDILAGGPGNDRLYSNNGDDVYAFNRGDGQDSVDNTFMGSSVDVDTLSFGVSIRPNDVAAYLDADGDLVLSIAGSTDTVSVKWFDPNSGYEPYSNGGCARVQFIDQNGAARVFDLAGIVGAFKDRLIASSEGSRVSLFTVEAASFDLTGTVAQAGGDYAVAYAQTGDLFAVPTYMSGTEGDDTIEGRAGNDTIDAGGGNNTVYSEDGDDMVTTGSGSDRIAAGPGNDVIFAGAGDDVIDAGPGNDFLHGGGGNDALLGGEGDDTYYFNRGDGALTIVDTAAPHQGNTLVFGPGITLDDLTLSYNKDMLVLSVGVQGDTIRLTNFDPNGAGGPHAVETYQFSDGRTLPYSQLIDRGFDLTGTEGDDLLAGTSVSDRIRGLGGDDILAGGRGSDLLDGGSGNDTYLFNRGDGVDTIRDMASETAGNSVQFGPGITISDLSLTSEANALVIRVGDGGDKLRLEGFSPSDVQANHAVETFRFSDGTALSYTGLLGLGFTFEGTPGNDALSGTNADDTFIGHEGVDVVHGGAGDDTYCFNVGDGTDTIEDRSSSSEPNTLVFGPGITPEAIRLGHDPAEGALVIYTGRNGDTICLTDFDATAPKGPHAVEYFQFSDGHVLTYGQLIDRGFDIIGSDGDDKLIGTAAVDRIIGNTGNDSIRGGPGNDTMAGGPGDDTYSFNLGDGVDVIDDVATISEGNTLVFGEGIALADMQNKLTFRDGEFAIRVGDGGDEVRLTGFDPNAADVGPRAVNTFQFADGTVISYEQMVQNTFIVQGDEEDNHLTGTNLTDRLYGYEGFDRLEGRSGNDVLTGGPGNDELVGGEGSDTYIFHRGDGVDTIYDTAGPKGENSLYFPEDIAIAGLTPHFDNTTFIIDVSANNDPPGSSASGQLTFPNFDPNNVLGSAAFGSIELGNGTIVTFEEFMEQGFVITGTLGNDILTGTSIRDRITGLEGNDTLSSGAGDDIIDAGDGNDTIYAGVGNDMVIGGGGNDVLNGEEGNDVLDGATGNDVLNGGAGSDRYVFARGYGKDVVRESGPADDIDEVAFAEGISSNDLSVTKRGLDLVIALKNSADEITVENWFTEYPAGNHRIEEFSFPGESTMTGAEIEAMAPKTIRGTDGDDVLYGTAYDDVFEGLKGNDTYMVNNQGDVVTELPNEGADTIVTSLAYVLPANVENLTLTGTTAINGSGNDLSNVITGNPGSNTLQGGSGNDSLDGGSGDDVLRGGSGDDVYIYGKGYGNDLIENNDTGYDTVRFKEGLVPDSLDYFRLTNDNSLYVRIKETGETLKINNWFAGNAYQTDQFLFADGTSVNAHQITNWARCGTIGTDGNDVLFGQLLHPNSIYGLGGNDLITGALGADLLDGGSGNDGLVGLAGNDELYGGRGTDALLAGLGDDILAGGGGNDLLDGGLGNDTYRFSRGDGTDTLTDLGLDTCTQDKVLLAGDIPKEAIALFRNGQNLIIGYGYTDTVSVVNQFRNDQGVERIELSTGQFLTNADINQVVQSITAFASSEGMSLNDVNDVRNSPDLMNIVMNAWHG